MKVGILTIHCNYNYGALLQAYALQEHIKGLGYEVSIINYRPQYLESLLPKRYYRMINPIKIIKYHFKHFPVYKEKYYKFKEFEKNLDETKAVRSRRELSQVVSEFDSIVFGSDQIWCSLFNGKDSIWYGDFESNSVKKISYAASAGDANYSEEELSNIVSLLNKFTAISVREKKLYDILHPRIDSNIPMTCTIDPSLMVDPKLWEKWYAPIRNDKYLIVRLARECPGIYKMAEGIASQLNCNIVNVDVRDSTFNSGYDTRAYSPDEFVSLIKNAECVLTNSFHGTAFSVVTGTPFYTIKMGDKQDERSTNLLKAIGLQERMVERGVIPEFKKIDFSEAFKLLKELRKESQQFLINSL